MYVYRESLLHCIAFCINKHNIECGTAGRQSVLTQKLIITEKIVSCFRSAVKDGRGERQ